ncbi:MAG: hypothetical protein QNJ36_16655 [Calothrix sp. MO_167.B42]|nr:hypothetical protein [Calothrix sp. MO_167.B42]
MARTQKLSKNRSRIYRSLVATAFITTGMFQLVAPALAQGTAAGTEIKNTATATYQDPNNPNETLNATSNEVVITIAEVAGITVTANGTTFQNDGGTTNEINNGDVLYYNYTVKNVGNDPTKFRIPNQPEVEGNGVLKPVADTAGTEAAVQISEDGGTTWVAVDSGTFNTNSIDPNGEVLVRVAVEVRGAASGDEIKLELGNTPSESDQNIPFTTDGNDLYTVDNADIDNVPGERNGVPVNGVREASDNIKVTVESTLKNYALATILKTRSSHTPAGDPGPKDDTLNYELSLRVEGSDVISSGVTPSALEGTTINVNGANSTHILVSDAIPKDTELAAAPTNVPSGWEAVYTTDSTDTNAAGYKDANEASWKKFPLQAPDTLSDITRVGFIKTSGTVNTSTTVPGFEIQLKVTDDVNGDGIVNVANIAQVFGASGPNPVYDESGDQTPSNYNDTTKTFPGTDNDSDGLPDELLPDAVEDGYIEDPDTLPDADKDTGNNNEGDGTDGDGEANFFQITTPADTSVLNGPVGEPAAESNGDNNKDFTNKSALIPAGTTPNSQIDSDGVDFTNTIQNTGTANADISLLPTPPATVTELPNETLVTITAPNGGSATYEYNGATFDFISASGTDPDGNPISATNPVRIDDVAPGVTATYSVEVDLPQAPLSTDIDRGFPVPITAFVDGSGADGTPDGEIDGDEAQNITIDQVYNGYLKLTKESAIVPTDGSQPVYDASAKTPAPGDKIAYRITARNISEPQTGTGNVILRAQNTTITEDGTTYDAATNPNGNNWALDNDENNFMDTTHVDSTIDTDGGAVELYTGENSKTISEEEPLITMYVVKYEGDPDDPNLTIFPGQQKVFIFQRQVENNTP